MNPGNSANLAWAFWGLWTSDFLFYRLKVSAVAMRVVIEHLLTLFFIRKNPYWLWANPNRGDRAAEAGCFIPHSMLPCWASMFHRDFVSPLLHSSTLPQILRSNCHCLPIVLLLFFVEEGNECQTHLISHLADDILFLC